MIEANNPDIDGGALQRRIEIELQQPERTESQQPERTESQRPERIEWQQPERLSIPLLPIPDVPVTLATPDMALTGVKHRLRAIPVLGSLLSVLNRWRRQAQARVLAIPYIGYDLSWLKSLALVHETRGIVSILTRELGNLEQRLNTEIELKLGNLEQRLNMALESKDAQLVVLRHQLEHEKKLTAGNREEIQFLQRRLAALGNEMANEKKLTAGNRVEILFQQRRLNAVLETGRVKSVAPNSVDAGASVAKGALDTYYAAFEEAFRGSREEIKSRQKAYLDRVAALATDLPILDIGCGRGEWIELLGERGIAAYGIDMNSVFVADARAANLDVRQADALGHLRSLADGSLSGITGFHIIEHLEYEELIDIVDEANRVLVPGGFLLFETPNPDNLIVGASKFWRDPTHRAPLPPSVTNFLIKQRGFIDTEVIYLNNGVDDDKLPGEDGLVQRLNHLLYCASDYAIWARKV